MSVSKTKTNMLVPARPRLAFVMEQTLGHVTHYTNMRNTLDTERGIDTTWYPLHFPPTGVAARLPVLRSNWSVRASLLARLALARDQAVCRYDALFFHTQVTSLLSSGIMRRVPTVVSLDATPANYDAVGAAYGHQLSSARVEQIKRAVNIRSLHAAAAIVTWCHWGRRSLVEQYGVDSARISVIAPGVDLALWPKPELSVVSTPIKLLFVGGDFDRKGGPMLVRAFASLATSCELHLVTSGPVDPGPRIHVYRDIKPNSEELRRLYATSDIFVLPTRADCFPLVIQEAMAAGLPVVSTDVGAIGEAVRHGETGLLIPPDDPTVLLSALQSLVADTDCRRRMGIKGREWAERHYDSAANAREVAQLMVVLASRSTPGTGEKNFGTPASQLER